ncbi:uncharacterized protein yc1106_04040 [Curvularia clavata]|uniref:Cytochrome P450 n=1 Tax=Curvularia clavata TaxID=95742 RepID=A0A9Q8Z5L7_CURCL|nr:uncharacterized protein yc1106_04040 [Curvularia clavata]
MDLSSLISVTTVTNLSLLFVVYWVGWIIYCRTFHPLAHVPGPLWPAVSNTWLRLPSLSMAVIKANFTRNPIDPISYANTVYHMYLGDVEVAQDKLHQQYGSLIRVAPNEVVSNDASAIPLIYRTHNPLNKTEWFANFRPRGISEHADLFTELDESKHNRRRRVVQPAYQMARVLKNEKAYDRCTMLLMKKLGELAAKEEDVDLGHWIELYAHDILGSVFFGRAFGYLEKGGDIDAFIESVATATPLMHVIAAAPSYVRGLILMGAMCIPGTLKGLKAIEMMINEAKRQTKLGVERSAEDTKSRLDVCSQLLQIVNEKGSQVDFTPNEVTLESWTGLLAGSDSTASTMRTILYFLMKNPDCMATAVQEIKSQEHLLSSPMTYMESTKHLPYVNACIKESSRNFSSVGISMSRVAPAQGIVLSNHHIPAGYAVGMNPYTVQRDPKLFGEDSRVFRPERWLQSQATNLEMEKGMITFGAGTHTCLGKNIALVEIHKLIPELLRRFDMHLVHDKPWRTQNAGFIKQKDIIVRLTPRA